MTEEKSEKCDDKCGCKENCCNSKSGKLLLTFMLMVIIILLSGIFYSLQGMMAMCPAMKNSDCVMMKGKTAPCPMTGKTQMETAK